MSTPFSAPNAQHLPADGRRTGLHSPTTGIPIADVLQECTFVPEKFRQGKFLEKAHTMYGGLLDELSAQALPAFLEIWQVHSGRALKEGVECFRVVSRFGFNTSQWTEFLSAITEIPSELYTHAERRDRCHMLAEMVALSSARAQIEPALSYSAIRNLKECTFLPRRVRMNETFMVSVAAELQDALSSAAARALPGFLKLWHVKAEKSLRTAVRCFVELCQHDFTESQWRRYLESAVAITDRGKFKAVVAKHGAFRLLGVALAANLDIEFLSPLIADSAFVYSLGRVPGSRTEEVQRELREISALDGRERALVERAMAIQVRQRLAQSGKKYRKRKWRPIISSIDFFEIRLKVLGVERAVDMSGLRRNHFLRAPGVLGTSVMRELAGRIARVYPQLEASCSDNRDKQDLKLRLRGLIESSPEKASRVLAQMPAIVREAHEQGARQLTKRDAMQLLKVGTQARSLEEFEDVVRRCRRFNLDLEFCDQRVGDLPRKARKVFSLLVQTSSPGSLRLSQLLEVSQLVHSELKKAKKAFPVFVEVIKALPGVQTKGAVVAALQVAKLEEQKGSEGRAERLACLSLILEDHYACGWVVGMTQSLVWKIIASSETEEVKQEMLDRLRLVLEIGGERSAASSDANKFWDLASYRELRDRGHSEYLFKALVDEIKKKAPQFTFAMVFQHAQKFSVAELEDAYEALQQEDYELLHGLLREDKDRKLQPDLITLLRSRSDSGEREEARRRINNAYVLDAVPFRIDSPEAIQTHREVMDIFRSVFEVYLGFGALTIAASRTPGVGESTLLRFGKDCAAASYLLNASRNDLPPGKGMIIAGVKPDKVFTQDSEHQEDPFHLQRTAWPWAARVFDDLALTHFVFTRGMIAILPPHKPEYMVNGVPYALTIFNEHFHNRSRKAGFLVPEEAVRAELDGTIIPLHAALSGFDASAPDLSERALTAKSLLVRVHRAGGVPLRLDWASNFAGLSNAFPPRSAPYHEWERLRKLETKDAAGHVHKSHILGGYKSSMTPELDRALEPLREAHDIVFRVSENLFALHDLFRLGYAAWTRGHTLTEDTRQEEMSITEDTEAFNEMFPGETKMLEEAYAWHSLRSQGIEDRARFPILTIADGLNYWDVPDSPIYLDTYDMTLSTGDSRFQLPETGDGQGAVEKELWQMFVRPHVFSGPEACYRFYRREELGIE